QERLTSAASNLGNLYRHGGVLIERFLVNIPGGANNHSVVNLVVARRRGGPKHSSPIGRLIRIVAGRREGDGGAWIVSRRWTRTIRNVVRALGGARLGGRVVHQADPLVMSDDLCRRDSSSRRANIEWNNGRLQLVRSDQSFDRAFFQIGQNLIA